MENNNQQRMLELIEARSVQMEQFIEGGYGRTYDEVRVASTHIDVCLNNLCSSGYEHVMDLYSEHEELRRECDETWLEHQGLLEVAA